MMTANLKITPAEPGTVSIDSRRFGPLAVREDQIIDLIPGLLGFSQFHRYVLIEHQQESPFLWLQSVDNPDLAFVVIDPLHIVPGYKPGPFTEVMQELEVDNPDDLNILVILTIPSGRPQEMTANLMGPVVINLKNRRGKQLVLEESRYSHKHRILPE
jgi:flagellar assembly factor FliW